MIQIYLYHTNGVIKIRKKQGRNYYGICILLLFMYNILAVCEINLLLKAMMSNLKFKYVHFHIHFKLYCKLFDFSFILFFYIYISEFQSI